MTTEPASSDPRIRTRNRTRCRVLSAADLIWRICEFIYAVAITFLPTLLNQQTKINPNDDSRNSDGAGGSKFLVLLGGGIQDKTQFHYEIMNTRVYNFLLNPILTFCYFIGFFLQISISFFLFCETSSYGKSASYQNELAACTIWSRIAGISLIILLLRFFLPYALITVTNVGYNASRVLFKIVGIIVVIIHGRELRSSEPDLDGRSSEIDEEDEPGHGHSPSDNPSALPPPFKTRFKYNNSSFEGNKSVFAEIELPPISTMPILHKFKKSMQPEYEKAKVHVVQVMAYVEKQMYGQALAELKIAQECLKKDSNLAKMEFTLQKMLTISGADQDYYHVLGISKNASPDAVKSAYRRKSLRHHPDKHATETELVQKMEGVQYLNIREAYETLSDPSRRSLHDEKMKFNRDKLLELQIILKTCADFFNNAISS